MPADPPPPPSRSDRARCYAARDGFFACLDAHAIVDPLAADAETRQHCAAQDAQLGRDCAASWAKYFKQQRVVNIKKERMLRELQAEGAKEVPIGGGAAGR